MNGEVGKFDAYKKKLQGVCDENNLVFTLHKDQYPIVLRIKVTDGLDGQMSMLEAAEDEGYRSPDARLAFYYKDGVLMWQISETFTIGDALFSRLKNLYKNLHFTWLQFFHRDITERGVLTPQELPGIEEYAGSDTSANDDMEQLEIFEDDEESDGFEDDDDDNDDGDVLTGDVELPSVIQDATRIVRELGQATVSLLQRRMSISHIRATRLMETLESLGVVGPSNGSMPREVLPYDQPEDPADGYEYERSEADDAEA
ncbi:MAG: hypothetical protein LBK75_08575 [Oscillospiraceae bacterium]|jgi:hypothetical protein|nr:hypothetical protein [Oscillospiraceae bacterium]